jgi:hypothetical protein
VHVVLLKCVIHPIDTAAHPTVAPGFRWVVMLGDVDPADTAWCANAGWCPTVGEAQAEGDQNAATAARAMQLLGIDVRYAGIHRLASDPIPPGADRLNVIG